MTKIANHKGKSRNALDARKARRDGFLDNAAIVFSQQGIRDTTMDQVAEHLSLSKVVLYRYFASKEDLIHSILERIADKMLALDENADQDTRIQGAATLRLARENRAPYILIVRDARNDPIFGAHYEKVHEAVSRRLKSYLLNEGLDPLMSLMCAEAYTDSCINGALNWLLNADPDRDAEYGEWLATGVIGMCAAWRAKGKSPEGFAPSQTQDHSPLNQAI